tara:strand:- start:8387 stop:9544 length:1158 start_codon:yes stop_codon:yes gene_type:complete
MYNLNQISKVTNVLKKNKTNYWTGNECKSFEKEFSKYVGNKYSIAVSNGSVALEIALKSLNLKTGDQVIVTPRSFIISASCVINQGLRPVFADVDKNGNLDINGISNAYNIKVKAIILVHLNGLPCDITPIIKFVKKKKLFLIEDCSQAHGAKYKGKSVGSFGDVSTWSFCQDKIISTGGEGGMISTNNKKIWQFCWSFKDHGKNYFKVTKKNTINKFKWLHEYYGSNYRMTEIQASLGRYQLKNLDKQIKKRNRIANLYIKNLKNFLGKNNFFQEINFEYQNNKKKNFVNAFYRLNLYVNISKFSRNKILLNLNNNKVQCGVGACPEIYLEKIFKRLKIGPKKKLKNAKDLGKRSLMFPINPYLSDRSIKIQLKKINKTLRQLI